MDFDLGGESFALVWALRMILALTRTGAMLLAMPGLNQPSIPRIAKGVFVIGLSGTIAFTAPPAATPLTFGIALVPLLLVEFIYGFVIGFIFSLPVHTAKFAGQIMGIEMGLSFSAVSDPLSQSNATVLSAILGTLTVQLGLAMGLERDMLAALSMSTHHRPLGSLQFSTSIFSDLLMLGAEVFSLALKLALPAMGTLFALKLSMAYLARLAPKLQIFNLTFTLTLLVGQWMIFQSLPSIGAALAEEYQRAMTLVWSIAQMVPDGPR